MRPDIPYISVLIEDDEGELTREYYSINYDWQIVYEEDMSLEGLHYLQVELLNIDEKSVGSMMFQ